VWKSGELAEKYLSGVRGAIPMAGEQIEIILRVIGAGSLPIDRVLDLGCGDGILAAAILERHPAASAVLVDISGAMIEAAKKRLSAYGDKITFITCDYGDRNWVGKVPASPFSVVVSGFSIHHQTDERKKELYSEIYHLLAPGGIFLNLEHVSSPTDWINGLFNECFVDSLYQMHLRNGTQMSREQVAQEFFCRDDKAANILAPAETQCEWLRTIGFEDVDCFFKLFELALFGGRKP
jgi:ubiquinone/menaquinone biosynthesis C-methylase UbiE